MENDTAFSAVPAPEELERLIGYAKLMSYYKCAMMEIETKCNVLNEEFSLRFDRNPINSIKTRLKKPSSIFGKLKRRGLPVDLASMEKNIHDIAGVRVICSFKDDVYMLADALLKQDDITLIEKKDYIEHPKQNGYRSLHLIVGVPIFLAHEKRIMQAEIQLRTIAMDFWASLEHKLYYKQGKVVPRQVLIGLNQCADLAALLDEKMQDIRNKMKPYLSEEERAVQAAKAEDEKCMNCLE